MAHSLLKPDTLTSISIITYAVIITTLISTALRNKTDITLLMHHHTIILSQEVDHGPHGSGAGHPHTPLLLLPR